MGQRHQVFVIAKVKGKYRTIAAIHHQWLYGRTAVRQCLHTCKVMQASASLIRQDLQAASRFDWTKLPEMQDTRNIFPIVTTTLVVGIGYNEESDYSANVHTIPIEGLPSQQDNNDGFTVLDATDPDRVRYCFFFQPDSEPLLGPDGHNLQPMVPITGSEYLSGYYKLDSAEGLAAANALRELEAFPLMDAATLQDAWPEEGFSNAGATPDINDIIKPTESLTLRARTLKDVVESAVQSDPSDLSWFASAEQFPDFAPALKARLQSEPSLANAGILGRVFQGNPDIDLTYYDGLSAADVLYIIDQTNLPKEKELTVALPIIDDLSVDHIQTMLSRWTLAKFHLARTVNISLPQLLEVLPGSSPRQVTHPGLFESDLDFHASSHGQRLDLSPKLRSAFPLCQVVYLRQSDDGNLKYIDTEDPGPESSGRGILAWSQNVGSGEARGVYSRGSIVPLPMHDILSQTTSLLAKIPSSLARILSAEAFDFSSWELATIGTAIAKHLALGDNYKLSPVPANLHHAYQQLGRSSAESMPKVRNLAPGEWTLFICHEVLPLDIRAHTTTRLRYAFVTLDDDNKEKPLVLGFNDFLKAASLEPSPTSISEAAFLEQLAEKACTTQRGEGGGGGGGGGGEVVSADNTVVVERCPDAEVEELVKAAKEHNGRIEEFEEMWGRYEGDHR